MTKHFIEYLLTAAMAVMTAQSCVSKIDPIFDESSANRVEALAERLNETLTGAPNGWLLEYYPSAARLPARGKPRQAPIPSTRARAAC